MGVVDKARHISVLLTVTDGSSGEYTHIIYIIYMSGMNIKILIVITVITVIFTSLIIFALHSLTPSGISMYYLKKLYKFKTCSKNRETITPHFYSQI